MDRKEALRILGLNENASQDEINRRMDILYRKFRNIERDENGYTLEDIDRAYKIASGIAYYDPEEEKKIKKYKENPGFIFRLLKIDEYKARNFIHYYKWHALIGLVVLVVVISAIVSVVTKVEPDLRIFVAGDLFVVDSSAFEKLITDELPNVKEPLVQNAFLGAQDPQMQMGMQMKYVAELAGGENDILIVDEKRYFEIAKQGGFKPITEVMGNEIHIDLDKHSDLVVKPDPQDGVEYEPELFGIDVTDSSILKQAGIAGDRFIVAFPHSMKNTENAIEFFKLVIEK